MSYNLSVFHPSVKKRVEEGEELDGFEHEPIEVAEMQKFIHRLGLYKYQLNSETPDRKGYIKEVAGVPVSVGVYRAEIGFSVPYGKSEPIFEALQDASELCDTGGLALFDPQTGEWLDWEIAEWVRIG